MLDCEDGRCVTGDSDGWNMLAWVRETGLHGKGVLSDGEAVLLEEKVTTFAGPHHHSARSRAPFEREPENELRDRVNDAHDRETSEAIARTSEGDVLPFEASPRPSLVHSIASLALEPSSKANPTASFANAGTNVVIAIASFANAGTSVVIVIASFAIDRTNENCR